MTDRKLAERYARALLAALPGDHDAERAQGFLTALTEAMDASAELRDVLLNPAVSRASRRAVLDKLAADAGAPALVRSFLAVVVDHNRAAALPQISRAFVEVREAEMGIVPATVTTAEPLGPDLLERTRAALEKLTGGRVRLTQQVEPALLGGAVTTIGSKVFDGSVRTQLTALRRKMVQE